MGNVQTFTGPGATQRSNTTRILTWHSRLRRFGERLTDLPSNRRSGDLRPRTRCERPTLRSLGLPPPPWRQVLMSTAQPGETLRRRFDWNAQVVTKYQQTFVTRDGEVDLARTCRGENYVVIRIAANGRGQRLRLNDKRIGRRFTTDLRRLWRR